MIDAPAPIPTEGVWTGDPADLPNWDAMPRRNRRRKRRSHYPIWLRYAAWLVGVAILVTIAQIAFHAVRSDPRDARVFAERELRLSMLKPNETVVSLANVWQRPTIDFYRATRGLLVLTSAPGDSARPVGGRLIFLGLQPRDPLSPPDAPPTFDEREWPVDTAVTVDPTRTFFLMSRGLAISAPRERRFVLGLPRGSEGDIERLRTALAGRYATLRSVGWQRREARRARDRSRLASLYEGRRAWYHTVRRGEALASVARMFNTTDAELRTLNQITGDRIRIGQILLVKPWTKASVPFPAGVVPEYAPPAAASVTPAPPAAQPPTTTPAQSPKPIRR